MLARTHWIDFLRPLTHLNSQFEKHCPRDYRVLEGKLGQTWSFQGVGGRVLNSVGVWGNMGNFLFLCLFWPHRAACGILVPRPGMEPAALQWKRWVLTTGPPGKSQHWEFELRPGAWEQCPRSFTAKCGSHCLEQPGRDVASEERGFLFWFSLVFLVWEEGLQGITAREPLGSLRVVVSPWMKSGCM